MTIHIPSGINQATWVALTLAGLSLIGSLYASTNTNDRNTVQRLSTVEARQDDTKQRLDRIEQRLDRIESKIDRILTQMAHGRPSSQDQ